MFHKNNDGYYLVKIGLLYIVFMVLCFWGVYASVVDHATNFDGGIIITDKSEGTI